MIEQGIYVWAYLTTTTTTPALWPLQAASSAARSPLSAGACPSRTRAAAALVRTSNFCLGRRWLFVGYLLQAGAEAEWASPPPVNSTLPLAPAGLRSGAYWAPGILQTAALVMLNALNWEAVSEDTLGDASVALRARLWVTVCFVVMFTALGGAIWILVENAADERAWKGAGPAVVAQNACIFAGSLIFRASRRHGEHAM